MMTGAILKSWKTIKNHIPLIKFRKGGPFRENTPSASASPSSGGKPAVSAATNKIQQLPVIEDWQLPSHYKRTPLDQKEIDAINMSLIPLLYRDWWDDIERPSRLFDQNFGLGLNRDELISSFFNRPLLSSGYIRPWRELTRQSSGSSVVKSEKDKFQVILDVQQFAPNEIVVKTQNNVVVVEGKHEEKQDEHGFISRHFVRKYMLPNDIEPTQISSTLSSDGVLTISAPRKTLPAITGERVVPINQTGQPAIKPGLGGAQSETPTPIVETPAPSTPTK